MIKAAISTELLSELNRLFPDKLPMDPVTIEQVYFKMGQRSVIQKLESDSGIQQLSSGLGYRNTP